MSARVHSRLTAPAVFRSSNCWTSSVRYRALRSSATVHSSTLPTRGRTFLALTSAATSAANNVSTVIPLLRSTDADL